MLYLLIKDIIIYYNMNTILSQHYYQGTVLLKKITQPSCGSHGRKLLLAKNSNALENLNHVFLCLAPLSGVCPLCLAGEEPHIVIQKPVFLECS